MSDLKIEVEGLAQLRRSLAMLEDKQLLNNLRDAHKKASQEVADAAANEAPVRTGRLKQSIKGRGSNRGASVKAGSKSRVPYAGPIHFGWPKRGIKANPFIYRGIKKKMKSVQDTYEKEVERIMRKAKL